MASFASSDDLAARLQKSFTQAEKDQAEQLLAGSTARIRAVTDQWISEVVDDVFTTDAPLDRVLWLPQRPVSTVTSVKVDGVTVTDWRLRGSRLIRACAWATSCDVTPPEVEVIYTHGLAGGDERLDLAKDACLAFAAAARSNPDGLKSESIDDYSRAFGNGGGSEPQWYELEKALCRQYGRRPKTGSINTAA